MAKPPNVRKQIQPRRVFCRILSGSGLLSVSHMYIPWASSSCHSPPSLGHGTDSAWLCGRENLGLSPGSGRNHPLRGRISVPRMVVAQFDSIRCERIYKKLVPEVLRSLDALLTSNNKKAWFTVFLATFLLLHQVAWTSRDRRRYTAQNRVGKRPVRFRSRVYLISFELTL
jgi:hypothetical protein